MNLRDFSSGDCFDAYKWLGAQFDGFGTTFRVYAPNAEGVSVIGDFNGWQDWYLNRRRQILGDTHNRRKTGADVQIQDLPRRELR